MELKIFEEKGMVVQLKLFKDEKGIYVIACDEDGEKVNNGNLIRFTNDGKIRRIGDIDKELGFKLDAYGRIETTD